MKRNYVFYVYDSRTQMTEFIASFAVRDDAVAYAAQMFGEHGYVSDRKLHTTGCVWNPKR